MRKKSLPSSDLGLFSFCNFIVSEIQYQKTSQGLVVSSVLSHIVFMPIVIMYVAIRGKNNSINGIERRKMGN